MARQCRDGRVISVRVSRWRRVLVGVLCAAYAVAVLCYWEWSWVQAALLLAGVAAGVWAMLLPHDVSELVLEDKGVAYVRYRGQKQPDCAALGVFVVAVGRRRFGGAGVAAGQFVGGRLALLLCVGAALAERLSINR